MKKVFYVLFAVSMIAAISCNKEIVNNSVEDQPENNTEVVSPVLSYPTIGVSAEGTTKAALDNSLNLIWKTGDKIGVRVYKGTTYIGTDSGSGYEAKDIDWNLSSGQETPSGIFSSSEALDKWHHWSYAAFYPANEGKGDSGNNVGGDSNVYIRYQTSYDGYVSGTSLMPMVANLNVDGLEGRPEKISLKHVGGSVIITLDNVPAEANKITLTVNQNITGWGCVNPANAGTAEITSASLTDGGKTVTLNFAEGAAVRDGMVFNFPVPTLVAPTITINLYRDNTLLWTKSTASAQADITRAGCLQMPTLIVPDMNYYSIYILDDTGWSGSDRALYIWDPSDNHDMGAWPGQKAIKTETISGKVYYKFLLPGSHSGTKYRMKFSNNGGGSESGVLFLNTLASTKSLYFRVTSKGAVTITDTADPEEVDLSNVSLLFKKNGNIDPVKIHYWECLLGSTSWPGVDLETETINGITYYKKSFTLGSDITGAQYKIIINDGNGTQSNDSIGYFDSFIWNGEFYFDVNNSGEACTKFDMSETAHPRWQ